MARHVQVWILLLLSLWLRTALAGELRDFELHDGSTLTGELVSLRGGVYTLKSPSLGTITLNTSQVRAIRLHTTPNVAPSTEGATQPALNAQIQQLQQTIMGDAALMQLLSSMLEDPEVQTVLADPTVMQAVQSQDFQALMTHPKVMQLLNHPVIRDISKRLSPE
jgi:hypothetical protein